MPQIHFSVDDRTASELASRARQRGLSLSRYLADLVLQSVPARWPEGYLDTIVGSCAGAPIEEPVELGLDQPELPERP